METTIKSYTELYTDFDRFPENRARRAADYERGLATGNAASEFHIGMNGVWSTTNKDGSSTMSYEKLGYHANTAYFFAGVIASGVTIIDHKVDAASKLEAMARVECAIDKQQEAQAIR